VLLTRRSQFLQKLSALSELVEELGMSFNNTVEELGEAANVDAQDYWEMTDSTHFDLNSCLREVVILLKCFLLALPASQLTEFQATSVEQSLPPKSRVPTSTRHLAHRRLATIKGQ
jgi:hypothetical protein